RMVWELYPRSREIILVRDFRDVFCSILSFNAKRDTADFGRGLVNSDERYLGCMREDAFALLRCWKTRSDKAKLVRYEDLIEHPEETLRDVFDYLTLEATSATVHAILQKASVETSEMQQHRTAPNSQDSVGRWRRDLNPSLRTAADSAFGDILTDFGYSV